MSTELEHFIITKFCIRNMVEYFGGPKHLGSAGDPLADSYLQKRLLLLECVCASSILNQTNKNFQWIIIVDKDLSERYKNKLLGLSCGSIQPKLKVYDAECQMENTDWLTSYMKNSSRYLLTTRLDDDDALPVHFVDKLQSSVHFSITDLPELPLKMFACSKIWMWTFNDNINYPVGIRSDWSRRNKVKFTSVGMSLLVKLDDVKYTVLGLGHGQLQNYLNMEKSFNGTHVMTFRSIIEVQLASVNKKLKDYRFQDYFEDLAPSIGHILVTNHNVNGQDARGFENKKNPIAVKGIESLPGFNIKIELITERYNQIKQDRLERNKYIVNHRIKKYRKKLMKWLFRE